MARLAEIRKQREEAAAQRKAEQEGSLDVPFPSSIFKLIDSVSSSAKDAEIEARKLASKQKR